MTCAHKSRNALTFVGFPIYISGFRGGPRGLQPPLLSGMCSWDRFCLFNFFFLPSEAYMFGHKCSQNAYSILNCVSVKLDCFYYFFGRGGEEMLPLWREVVHSIGTAPFSIIMKYFSISCSIWNPGISYLSAQNAPDCISKSGGGMPPRPP